MATVPQRITDDWVTSADGSVVPVDVYWSRVSQQKDILAMQSTVTSWLLLKQLCQSAMANWMLNEDFL